MSNSNKTTELSPGVWLSDLLYDGWDGLAPPEKLMTLPHLLGEEETSTTKSLVTGLKTPPLVEVDEDGGLLTDDEEPQLR